MLRPIGDHVIVKVKKEEGETVGGIVSASNAKEKPAEGEVVAVGNDLATSGGKVLPMIVKGGDRVVHDKYSGIDARYDGEEYLILHEKDILATVE